MSAFLKKLPETAKIKPELPNKEQSKVTNKATMKTAARQDCVALLQPLLVPAAAQLFPQHSHTNM